jgi:ankyrin repeat protein
MGNNVAITTMFGHVSRTTAKAAVAMVDGVARTPLHYASMKGWSSVVEALLAVGADPFCSSVYVPHMSIILSPSVPHFSL